MTTQAHNAPRKILIVDDNRIMRHLLRLTFADTQRFQIFEAESAETALPLVMSEKPNLIILDIMMPGDMDGFQLCQLIKSSPELSCTVILLSAKSQKDDVEYGKDVGADFYVTKPFSPAELIQLVEQS